LAREELAYRPDPAPTTGSASAPEPKPRRGWTRAVIEAPRQARRIGYGRVSTLTQTEEPQRAALEAAGCNEIHILTICKLDRRARSLKALLAMAEEL